MQKPNVLSVDLEFWLSRIMEAAYFDRRNNDNTLVDTIFEETVVHPTEKLLEIFARLSVRTTFFTTNSIFMASPKLIDKIYNHGHEIAFHGYTHNDTSTLSEQIENSRKFLSKYKVRGFRVPEMNFSANHAAILAENGFQYDSSLYGGSPYGISPGTTLPLLEIPVSCWPADKTQESFISSLRNCRLPFGSGLFISLFPALFISGFIRKLNKKTIPAVLFIHQWQLADKNKLKSLFQQLRKSSDNAMKALRTRDIYSLACITSTRVENILKGHSFARMEDLLNG